MTWTVRQKYTPTEEDFSDDYASEAEARAYLDACVAAHEAGWTMTLLRDGEVVEEHQGVAER